MTDTIFANFGGSQEWVLAGRLLLWQNQQHHFPPQSRPPTPEQLRALAAQWAVESGAGQLARWPDEGLVSGFHQGQQSYIWPA